MNGHSGALKSALLAGVMVALAAPASAQDEAVTLEDIVVTAQRRSERLQDVPMAITALNQEALTAAGINQTADLARVTPGLVLPYYGGGIQPSLRGVSSQGANVGDASNVAIYVDGIYQPNPLGNMFDLADTQQVEVLKGPQGTLYGQNATGGAIIITTLKPSFTWTGQLKASYGNYDDRSFNGYVSGPLNEKLAFSLAGLYQERDGFREHVITDQRDKGLLSKLVRGKLLFQPTDDVSILLSGYLSRRADSSPYAGHAHFGNTVGRAFFPNYPRATSSKQFEADPMVGTVMNGEGYNLKVDIDTDLGTLSSVTSFAWTRYDFLADVDYSPVQYALTSSPNYTAALMKTRNYIQEVNFASRDFGGFNFTTGVFYLNGFSALVPSAFHLRSPRLIPTPPGPVVFNGPQNGQVDKEIWAAYLELAYKLNDKLTLTAGGRYSSEKQKLWNDSPATPGVFRLAQTDTFKKFVPRVTAKYALTPRDNVYASVSRGFKSGILQRGLPPAQPEVLTAYEIGYKGRPLDRVSFNVSAYLYDYKDLQVFRYELNTSILENAAEAEIKGVDVETSIALTDGLTLNAGASFLDGKYKSFPAAAIFVTAPGSTGNQTVSANLKGERIMRAPKVTGTISLSYKREMEAGEIGGYVGYYYNDGYKTELTGKILQKSYTTIDAEVSFSPNAFKGLRLVAWGRNLSNEDYFGSVLASALADGVTYAPPRTYGVRAEYKF